VTSAVPSMDKHGAYCAIKGLKTGEVFVSRGSRAKTSDSPVYLWFGILQWVLMAIVFLVAMVVVQL